MYLQRLESVGQSVNKKPAKKKQKKAKGKVNETEDQSKDLPKIMEGKYQEIFSQELTSLNDKTNKLISQEESEKNIFPGNHKKYL